MGIAARRQPGPRLRHLQPMLLCEAAPFANPDWVFELKFDGYRLLAEFGGDDPPRLQTRNGADASTWFPEVVASLLDASGGRHVIDGEVCVLDDSGRSDFEKLHARARLRGYRLGAPQVVLCAFDVLVAGGHSVMAEPLLRRKEILAGLFAVRPPAVLPVQHFGGDLGPELYAQAVALRLEGVVGKRAESAYRPGERSPDWVKIKRSGATPAKRWTQEREP